MKNFLITRLALGRSVRPQAVAEIPVLKGWEEKVAGQGWGTEAPQSIKCFFFAPKKTELQPSRKSHRAGSGKYVRGKWNDWAELQLS